MQSKPLYFALILAALLLSLHLYALNTDFYWYHRWADIPMHILGGAALGAFLQAFFNARRTVVYYSCILAIVVGWEVFENLANISTVQSDYWINTATDLANGIIGATIAYVCMKKPLWR